MRLYESVFIVRPDIEADQVVALRDKVKDLLGGLQAPQVRWESWGKRKLAYPIRKYPKGIYLYVLYLGTAETVAEVDRILRLQEDVLRHMTHRVLDDVDASSFDFESWKARLSPLAERHDGDEFGDAPDDSADPPRPPRAEGAGENDKNESDAAARPRADA